MKTNQFFAGLMLVFGCAAFLNAPSVLAETKARDLSVDAALAGSGNLAGVLPATAGGAMAAGPLSGQQVFIDPARPDKFPDPAFMVSDRADKKARVFEVSGNVKVTKKGSADWKKLRANTWIEEGDTVLTEKGGKASVAFDAKYLNVTHIPENTRAIFRSIEPLDLFIEDGTVFNMFDGLTPNSQWKVSTPTAVAAVRGTYFVVRFTAANGDIFTATFNVPDDGHESKVELKDVQSGSAVDIPEGKEVDLKEGETLDASQLDDISQEWLDQIEELLKEVAEKRRNQGSNRLPPTSGEFFEPNTQDPGGQNNVGGGLGDSDIDPLEHGSAGTSVPEPITESSDESEPPIEREYCQNCEN